MVEMEIEYLGELRCAARHLPSGACLYSDAPLDNEGRGESFSPTDLAATALGTCMLTILGIVARRHGIVLDAARVRVRKIMTSNPPRRIARLEVDLFLPLPANHPRRELLEKAARECPVALSLHPEIAQAVEFHWHAPTA